MQSSRLLPTARPGGLGATMAGMQVRVLVESTPRRSFASALDWPGWARSGRTAGDALEALADRAERYRDAVGAAGGEVPVGAELLVVESLPGTATTEFGAPDLAAAEEVDPMPGEAAERAARIVRAAWTFFDAVVAVSPEELAKGPRGGGRDRDAMVEHVLGAESAYARKLGLKVPQPEAADPVAVEALRAAVVERIMTGTALPRPRGGAPWPVAYAARRIAWHVLDHAWEMQDRS